MYQVLLPLSCSQEADPQRGWHTCQSVYLVKGTAALGFLSSRLQSQILNASIMTVSWNFPAPPDKYEPFEQMIKFSLGYTAWILLRSGMCISWWFHSEWENRFFSLGSIGPIFAERSLHAEAPCWTLEGEGRTSYGGDTALGTRVLAKRTPGGLQECVSPPFPQSSLDVSHEAFGWKLARKTIKHTKLMQKR